RPGSGPGSSCRARPGRGPRPSAPARRRGAPEATWTARRRQPDRRHGRPRGSTRGPRRRDPTRGGDRRPPVVSRRVSSSFAVLVGVVADCPLRRSPSLAPEDLPGVRPVETTDVATRLQLVDDPGGPRIADLQPPLEKRRRGTIVLPNDLDGIRQNAIRLFVREVVDRPGTLVVGLDDLHVVVRILYLLGPVLDDAPDLGIGDEHALEAHRPGQVRRLVA